MCGGFPSANVKRTLSLGVGILTFPSGGGVGGVGGVGGRRDLSHYRGRNSNISKW